VQDAVEAQAHVGDIGGGVGHQVTDEAAFGFDFLLDLGAGLFQHAPFGHVAVNDLHVVVPAFVVDFHLDQMVAGDLQSVVDQFHVVVVEAFALFGFGLHAFLDVEFGHFGE
jgi:hypothetical protein